MFDGLERADQALFFFCTAYHIGMYARRMMAARMIAMYAVIPVSAPASELR